MTKGTAYILSAPAGTGKTTLVDKLTEEFPKVVRNVSYTTRSPREGEKDGVDYHFVSFQEFERKIKRGDFLEYAEVFGNFYGTCIESVEKLLEKGFDTIMVIDTQGADAVRNKFHAVHIFLSPPSMEELERRLKARKTENQEQLKLRLSVAKEEMKRAHQYDYHIVNCDLEKAYSALKSIFIAQKYKVKKNKH